MLAHPQRQLAAEPLIGVFVAKVGNVGFDFASKWVGCGFTRDQRRVRIGGWWMAMNLAAIALARWGRGSRAEAERKAIVDACRAFQIATIF
jgi:hypothetical protein